MSRRLSRYFAGVLLALSTFAMVSISFDAEARRFGGGASFGRQSSNVTQQRQAATPPTTTQRSASQNAASSSTAAAGGAAARSGMSRFLGPIAGIAAGLGIAALLSQMGLSGAFLEFMSSLLLIALLAFAIMFIVRRLRGAASGHATQSAGMQRSNREGAHEVWRAPPASPAQREAASAAPAASGDVPGTLSTADQGNWFIPEGFDTGVFLANAKKQFLEVQRLWDQGNIDGLSEYLTDDMVAEFRPQIQAREGREQLTEVLLLNAELLGIEAISDGHLASVRYSGMLREEPGAEAVRIEEVWNLYKADGSGWLLAGLQQLSSNNG
ncbi:MAG TPA: hypothetical protein DEB15_11360 [Pusillimonas sp.]|nr:hypothetical protein [Pusillimonas sp.]MBC42727.1 hypothetical protein [Pusillimonas sp.]HBT33370.1 hypothetical protein [Pusillimonas sp.]HCN72837.1 hypothetical protein [Pusillimonas sp.]|tara:strand:- start:35291 stop:36268 length:978 start_codon:yes stop_codon:yes gene_type:complete